MASNPERLIEMVGIERAAEHMLGQDPRECETFFRANYEQLRWDRLLIWLGRDPPEGAPQRPEGAVIDHIVETMPLNEAFDSLDIPHMLANTIADTDLRAEVVERIVPRLDEQKSLRLMFIVTASPIYDAIRDEEINVYRNGIDYALPVDGDVPWITPRLFDVRRHDKACRRVLREALADEHATLYTIAILDRANLLSQVCSMAEAIGNVPLVGDADGTARARIRYLLGLAYGWPVEEQRRGWFVERALQAAEAGADWTRIWWEIPPEFRDDVALASIKLPKPAPWVWRALARKAPARDAWESTFEIIDRGASTGLPSDFRDVLVGSVRFAPWGPYAPPWGPTDDKKAADEAIDEFWRGTAFTALTVLTDSPLPPDADDAFDERFVQAVRRCAPHPSLFPSLVVGRLLQLPLTPARARRIFALSIEGGSFWMNPRCEEIARAAAPIDGIAPPPPPIKAEAIAAYRALVGATADQRLAEQLNGLLSAHDVQALWLAKFAPTLVTDARKLALKKLACDQPLAELPFMLKAHSWLLSEADVVQEFIQRDHEDWGSVHVLPKLLSPLMEARAVTAPDPQTAEALLGRLEKLETPRHDLLRVALDRLHEHGPSGLDPTWFARILATRTAWDEHGAEVVAALLAIGNADGGDRVIRLCTWLDSGAPVVEAMHTAIAHVLVRLAGDALRRKDKLLAWRALRALGHLSPATRVRQAVRALRELLPDEEVLGLIEINEGLLRTRNDSMPARRGAIGQAMRALAGQDEDGDT